MPATKMTNFEVDEALAFRDKYISELRKTNKEAYRRIEALRRNNRMYARIIKRQREELDSLEAKDVLKLEYERNSDSDAN